MCFISLLALYNFREAAFVPNRLLSGREHRRNPGGTCPGSNQERVSKTLFCSPSTCSVCGERSVIAAERANKRRTTPIRLFYISSDGTLRRKGIDMVIYMVVYWEISKATQASEAQCRKWERLAPRDKRCPQPFFILKPTDFHQTKIHLSFTVILLVLQFDACTPWPY